VTQLAARLLPLADRYPVERELGRGGTATVYLAHDLRHDRPVALKVLHPEVAPLLGPERFVREIRLAARLQHPHILPLFDSGETDGLLWYTMPYVQGESLRPRLTREGRLPVADALEIARAVGAALDYAHRHGVVHRDIKPENILLHEAGALVADFGIARALDAAGPQGLTVTGLILGTPTYMSPEQAAGERDVDGRSDLYALACTLFEMLAGEPPFTGETPQSQLIKRFTQPPPSIQALRPELSGALDQALRRALAREPEARFDSVGAFLSAASIRAPEATPVPVQPEPSTPRSIVVLPFSNLSPDPENEFFTDGMTDELINALAKVEGLHVVSRTSAFAFKGTTDDVRTIGTRLSVGAVLEGSVRRAGRRLRLSAQLVDVRNGFQLWSETFDRELEDVFAIQDEISRAIVATLQVRLLGVGRATLVRPATADLEAYTLYLKGRQLWNRRSVPDLLRSVDLLEEALARDPEYALAHAGLADSHALLGFYCVRRPVDAFGAAKRSALRALALDPALAEARPALAYVAMYHDWDWDAAEREFQQALRLNPGYATAHQWYGNFLSILGRVGPSLVSFERAVALDPLAAIRHAALGWGYYFARQYEAALDQCRRALEIDAALPVAHHWLALVSEELGAWDQAETAMRRAAELSGHDGASLASLATTLARRGRQPEARALLAELEALRRGSYVSAYDFATIHAALRETAPALDWLERAYGERTHRMAFLRVDPRLDPLRGEPRFQELLGRMAFP
jgi:serine/threonine protein kinase/Tfp pilus assembly protein PilF